MDIYLLEERNKEINKYTTLDPNQNQTKTRVTQISSDQTIS